MIKNLPSVNFKIRVRDESIGGDNPYKWVTKNTGDKLEKVFARIYYQKIHLRNIGVITKICF